MNYDSLRKYCTTLPGATVDVKWGADECHCVGGRMFAVFPLARGRFSTVSFPSDPTPFLALSPVPGIVPAPYHARAHWVQVAAAGALTDAQARELVARSHALVTARLTRRERDAITSTTDSRRTTR